MNIMENEIEPVGLPDYLISIHAPTCEKCGAELDWVDCWMCGGDGTYDETETDPLEGDEFAICPECGGNGGYLECPDLPHID